MIYDINIAKQVAEYLLQINAIILQPNNPFQWASGWKSPIYCDNRKILSFPEKRTFIKKNLASVITQYYKGANVIAGVATAGIPHGALVAEELGLPFIYVRSKAKDHGKQNKIEGHFEKGQTVILIEDLISSGKSSLDVVESLRNIGMKVKGLVSIFNYGFDISTQNFKDQNCDFISLCDYENILSKALEINYISQQDLPVLQEWRSDPSIWKQNCDDNI